MIPTTDIVANGKLAGWRTVPFWSLFRRQKKTGFPDEELLSVYRDYGVIPKSARDDNHNKESEDLSGYQLVTTGALVTNKMKAWQGSIAISRYRGIVSPAYYVYTPQSDECDQFLHYLLRSDPYIGLYGRISKGVRVNQWDLEHEALRNIPVLLPDLATQRRIADFLDRETARIDLLIEKKQRLVALLGERKTIELEKLLFESGFHIRKLRREAQVISKGTTPSTIGAEMVDDGIRFLKAENVTWSGVSTSPENFISEKTHRALKRSSLQPGDVLVVIAGATTGKTAVMPAELAPANTNQAVSFVRLREPRYAHIVCAAIGCPRIQRDISLTSVQSAQPNLSMEDLGNLMLPFPDEAEISTVFKQVIAINSQSATLIAATQTSIDRLKEYRSALITAAVTGQIDVTTYARSGTTDRRLDAIQEEMQA